VGILIFWSYLSTCPHIFQKWRKRRGRTFVIALIAEIIFLNLYKSKAYQVIENW